jgi:lipopolysaccharide/colanic/teichoic acid biosynthesis glycosyltransferase
MGEAPLFQRVVDVLVGTVLALVALPIVVPLALGTWVTLRANPFFVQERIGRDGHTFRLVKLRTLPPEAPAYADKYAIQAVKIPAFCRLLRRFHLDELPQLFLVPVGRMSLVGPRPEMAFLHEKMPHLLATERVQVLPGCTGLWQVSEACSGLILESPQYDLFYLHHRSLLLDLWVMWRTALKFLNLGRPITLGQVPLWAYAPAATYPERLHELQQELAA